MKIKGFLPVLCALAVFSSVSLMAQSDPNNSSTPPPAAPAVHVGTDNPYKIGTINDPIIAEEYCAFLKTKAGANQKQTTPFYDNSFMIEQSWGRFGPHVTSNPNACISFTISYPDCSFDLLTGHENDIIDGVQSEQVQKEFNAWRQNPKVTELCEFMNAQISGDVDTANAIQSKYPASTCGVFDQLAMYAHNYVFYSMQTEYTYCTSTWYLDLQDLTSIYESVSMSDNNSPGFRLLATSLFFRAGSIISTAPPGYSYLNKLPITQREAVLCSSYGVDELHRNVLTKGDNPHYPATVSEGSDYYRPSQITTPMDSQQPYYQPILSLP